MKENLDEVNALESCRVEKAANFTWLSPHVGILDTEKVCDSMITFFDMVRLILSR